MNSVANVLEQSPVFERFQALAKHPGLNVSLEIEARIGKLMEWRSRYRSQFLTETLVETQIISLTDEQIISVVESLKSRPVIPQATLVRDDKTLELQFVADIPPEHFRFLSNIHKLRFNNFMQKNDGTSGPIQIRQREDENGKVLERITKIRLVNFDVSTKFDFDYRISMALEAPCPEFITKDAELRRRASMTFEGVQCDMTETQQVQEVELEALTSDLPLEHIIRQTREVCAVLSDYCEVYAKEEKPEPQEEVEEVQEAERSDEFD